MNIFAYGNLIVPSVQKPIPISEPLCSVYIRGLKPIIEKHLEKEYYYFKLILSNGADDIIFGTIVDVKEEDIEKLDQWEGKGYYRREMLAWNRNMQPIKCFVYLAA